MYLYLYSLIQKDEQKEVDCDFLELKSSITMFDCNLESFCYTRQFQFPVIQFFEKVSSKSVIKVVLVTFNGG